MDIDIIVPWGIDGNLGGAYNRSMRECVKDWVCFMDHDILQLNPNWYKMIVDAVNLLGHKAGWITGTTNAIACVNQIYKEAPATDDIVSHMKFAKYIYTKHQNTIIEVNPDDSTKLGCLQLFSGFLIVTHKKAWEAVGGFKNGFLGVDNEYCKALRRHNYGLFVLPGLYMYHLYRTKMIWKTL